MLTIPPSFESSVTSQSLELGIECVPVQENGVAVISLTIKACQISFCQAVVASTARLLDETQPERVDDLTKLVPIPLFDKRDEIVPKVQIRARAITPLGSGSISRVDVVCFEIGLDFGTRKTEQKR